MRAEDAAIQFHEYPDSELPERLRIQVLDFLRIAWPEGFTAIDADGVDIGVLMRAPNLIDFYSQAGWSHTGGARVVAGPDDATWTLGDVLMTRTTSVNSTQFLRDIKGHPMRVDDEW